MPIGAPLDRKIAAAQAYATQIGAVFQRPENIARILRNFALTEGGGRPAERLTGQALPAFLLERPG